MATSEPSVLWLFLPPVLAIWARRRGLLFLELFALGLSAPFLKGARALFLNNVLCSKYGFQKVRTLGKEWSQGSSKHCQNRKGILYLAHSSSTYHPSGYTKRSEEIVRALVGIGVDIQVAYRYGYPLDLGLEVVDTNSSSICPENYFIDFVSFYDSGILEPDYKYLHFYALYLSALLEEKCPRVVHANSNYKNGLAAVMACKAANIPCIYEVRGLWHLTRAAKNLKYQQSSSFRYHQEMELLACMTATKVVTISTGLRNYLVKNGVPPEKITIIPNSITESGRQKKSKPELSAFLRQYFPRFKSGRLLGYVGSIVSYEGLEFVLDFMASEYGKEYFFLVVGSGAHLNALVAYSKRIGVFDRCAFSGYLFGEQLEFAYAVIDFFLLPRKKSTMTELVSPLKPYEILARKKRPIVSPVLYSVLESNIQSLVRKVNFDDFSMLSSALLDHTSLTNAEFSQLPTWNQTAITLDGLYKSLSPN